MQSLLTLLLLGKVKGCVAENYFFHIKKIIHRKKKNASNKTSPPRPLLYPMYVWQYVIVKYLCLKLSKYKLKTTIFHWMLRAVDSKQIYIHAWNKNNGNLYHTQWSFFLWWQQDFIDNPPQKCASNPPYPPPTPRITYIRWFNNLLLKISLNWLSQQLWYPVRIFLFFKGLFCRGYFGLFEYPK